jgi:uncharacterized protein (PEP-CTERM system associated)
MWGVSDPGRTLDILRHRKGRLLCLVLLISGQTSVYAAQWQLHPTLQLEEVYTDNVTLAPPSQAETDFVTGVNPGFGLAGEGGRIKVKVNYLLQNYLYANNDSYNGSHQQLAATSTAELTKNIFFVDARSSISQQIINPQGPIGIGNINPTGNRSDVFTYGISPYLKLRMHSYANAELRYDIDKVEYQNANVSGAQNQRYSLRINSGPKFYRLNWNIGYKQEDLRQSSAFDRHTKSANLTVRYGIVRWLHFLAYSGYEDNQVPVSSTASVVNGSYWSAGLEWMPSRHITASATTGNNYSTADLMLSPIDRTSLHIGYRKQSVGLLVGPTWTADLSHYTRRTTWRASYSEQRSNIQSQQFLGQQFFQLQDSQGNIVIDPSTGFPVILARNVFGLVNDEFISKRSQATVTLNTGKSDILLAAYKEHREYILNPYTQDVVGTQASWNWRFAARLQTKLSGSWQTTKQENTSENYDTWYGTVALVRTISQRTKASLEYQFLERNSSVGAGDYRENRVTMQLNASF